MGKTARISLAENLLIIKEKLSIDFVLVNAENATSGVGLSVSHAKLLFESGVNCISLGVHSSLEMSGLIATISGELFKNNIPANVFSGYFHDHIFVPIDKAKLALSIISSIRSS